jgi:hypothetical protein
MVRTYKKRKYEKEIRPRIKLYKFENVPEDIQNKMIEHEQEFASEIATEDLSSYANEEIPELLKREGFKDVSGFELGDGDLYEGILNFDVSFVYKRFGFEYNKGHLIPFEYGDYSMKEIPDNVYEEAKSKIEHVKSEMLKLMNKSYEASINPDNIRNFLIEEGELYDINGDRH